MAAEFYKLLCFELETSKLNSLRCKNPDMSDNRNFTLKYYKADGTEITDQSVADAHCAYLVIDYFPPFDYQMESGAIIQKESASADAYVNCIMSPDIPQAHGGSIPALLNYNLHLGPAFFPIPAPKLLDVRYDPITRSSVVRIRVDHSAGFKTRLMGYIKYI